MSVLLVQSDMESLEATHGTPYSDISRGSVSGSSAYSSKELHSGLARLGIVIRVFSSYRMAKTGCLVFVSM